MLLILFLLIIKFDEKNCFSLEEMQLFFDFILCILLLNILILFSIQSSK